MKESAERVKMTPEIKSALRDIGLEPEEWVLVRLFAWGFSVDEIVRRIANIRARFPGIISSVG